MDKIASIVQQLKQERARLDAALQALSRAGHRTNKGDTRRASDTISSRTAKDRRCAAGTLGQVEGGNKSQKWACSLTFAHVLSSRFLLSYRGTRGKFFLSSCRRSLGALVSNRRNLDYAFAFWRSPLPLSILMCKVNGFGDGANVPGRLSFGLDGVYVSIDLMAIAQRKLTGSFPEMFDLSFQQRRHGTIGVIYGFGRLRYVNYTPPSYPCLIGCPSLISLLAPSCSCDEVSRQFCKIIVCGRTQQRQTHPVASGYDGSSRLESPHHSKICAPIPTPHRSPRRPE